MMTRVARKSISMAATVSYLLVATLSGMLHNHGSTCDHGDCRQAPANPVKRSNGCPGATAHSDHSHRHTGHAHRGHRHAHPPHAHEQSHGKGGHSHDPWRHDDCSACRFLAQCSLPPAVFRLELTETCAPQASDEAPRLALAITVRAHPPRGPPAGA